jgi:hypothetical protein
MSKERKGPSETVAMQRHANFYIGLLMDKEKQVEDLYIEMPQIALAKHRIDEELIGSSYHPGMIDIRFREVSGGYTNIYLAKLVQGTATKEDLGHIDTAVGLVEKGEAEYPVQSNVLRGMYDKLNLSFLKK